MLYQVLSHQMERPKLIALIIFQELKTVKGKYNDIIVINIYNQGQY